MKLIKYMLRWQLSSPILAICIVYLPFNDVTKTIIANIIGALVFYNIDKSIFNKGG